MSESEPTINLKIGSQEFEMTPSNSELYHYMGALAVWNHLFVQTEESEELRTGAFIPRELIGHEQFDQIGVMMAENGFPCRINQREVAEGDVEIITKILAGKDVDEINDQFPDWLPQV